MFEDLVRRKRKMLTWGELKNLVAKANLPDTTPVCLPYNVTDVNSIDVNVNVVSVLTKEHSYGEKDRITLAISHKYPSGKVTVRKLIDKNTWDEKALEGKENE